eukprot:9481170-Pyramimonas_sp.AAC.2
MGDGQCDCSQQLGSFFSARAHGLFWVAPSAWVTARAIAARVSAVWSRSPILRTRMTTARSFRQPNQIDALCDHANSTHPLLPSPCPPGHPNR